MDRTRTEFINTDCAVNDWDSGHFKPENYTMFYCMSRSSSHLLHLTSQSSSSSFYHLLLCDSSLVEKHLTHMDVRLGVCLENSSLGMIAQLITWLLYKWGLTTDPHLSCSLTPLYPPSLPLILSFRDNMRETIFRQNCLMCLILFHFSCAPAGLWYAVMNLVVSVSLPLCSLSVSRNSMWIKSWRRISWDWWWVCSSSMYFCIYLLGVRKLCADAAWSSEREREV